MATKKKRKKNPLSGRPRDSKGRLLKKARSKKRSAAKRPKVKRVRRSAARTAHAPATRGKRGSRKPKKSSARKSSRKSARKKVCYRVKGYTTHVLTGSRKAGPQNRVERKVPARKQCRTRKRHLVRGHTKRVLVGNRKLGPQNQKTVTVKSHYSLEEAMAMAEAARRGRRRRRRRSMSEAGERRSRRRRRVTKARVSRTVRGKKRSTTVRLSAYKRPKAKKVSLTRKRRGRKVKRAVWVSEARRTRRRRRRHARASYEARPRRRRRAHARRRTHARRRRSTHMREFYANPIGGGAGFLENPLSGGELALALVTGSVGIALTDLLDRYMATQAATSGGTALTGASAAAAIQAAPSGMRILAQGAATFVPLGLAYLVKNNMGRAALQGLGIGAGLHLLGQVVKTMLLPKMLGSNATAQSRLLPDVFAANPPTASSTGTAGLPVGVGAVAPMPIRTIQMGSSTPPVAVQGGGVLPSSPPIAPMPPTFLPPPGGYASVGPVASSGGASGGLPGGCAPCSAETTNAALASAFRAAQADNGTLGTPVGFSAKPGRMEIAD